MSSSSSPSSCERISSADFYSADAQLYSAKCVDELTHSKPFHAYVRHIQYRERLFLLWCIIPIGVLSVLYNHYALCITHVCPHVAILPSPQLILSGVSTSVKLANVQGSGSSFSEKASETMLATSLPYVTLFLVLYLLPSVVVAPFVGFFGTPSKLSSLHAYMLLTAVSVLVVSVGGSWFHSPPFIVSSPTISRVTDKLLSTLLVVAQRALPLQGLLMASFAISMWQRIHWRRVWHLYFPLVTVPLLVGLVGVTFWRATTLAIPHFVHSNGTVTSLTTSVTSTQLLNDVDSAWLLVRNVGMSTGTMILGDLQSVRMYIERYGVSARGLDATQMQALYQASLSLTLSYFVTLILFPVIRFSLSVAMLMLPTHPTTWLLNVLASCAALGAMLYSPVSTQVHLGYLVGVAIFIAALLYNGFVA